MTPEELLSEFDTYNFDYFMNESLSRVPEGIDIREGSIIYDALAPAAWSFTEMALNIKNVLLNTYTQTAQGIFLDYRAQENGLVRLPATFGELKARFTDPNGIAFNPPIGTRFSTIGDETIYYEVSKKISDGIFSIVSTTAGSATSSYLGQILPIDNISGLGYAEIIDKLIPGRDVEDDEALRARILASVGTIEYGGNIADYLKIMSKYTNVGATQIYPTWKGGGTVKIVILNNDFDAASSTLVAQVQEDVDPGADSGNGYGFAPIGHTVTVAAPTIKTIEVSAKIATEPSKTAIGLTSTIENKLKEFFLDLRKKDWATLVNNRGYALTVFASQVSAAILDVDGVVNVSELKLNGQAGDVVIKLDNTTQEVPMLGRVTISG